MLRSLQVAALSTCMTAALLALSGQSADAGAAVPLANGSNAANASSWLAGAHAGYNWQQGTVVYGFETDLSATHLNSTMSGGLSNLFGGPLLPGESASTSASIDWYGTLRGRLGTTLGTPMGGPLLVYGTAGLAYGNVGLSSAFSDRVLSLNQQTSSTRAGWVVGAGVEYLVRPDLSLTLGYQYVDLGNLSLADPVSAAVTVSQSATAHAQFSVVSAGFSWHFPPMAPAGAPWQGGYVGGQAGGAWGNHTDATYNSTVPLISDARLKRDIALVGRRDDGLGIYRYRYLWSDAVYVGVMAQEVALIHPDAVVRDPLTGSLAVDYGRLGLHLMTLPPQPERL
ncbi:MAG: outer membrane beta-barrel protein [Xanthobacteraceae bacterium]